MSAPAIERPRTVAADFEAGGLWTCRQLNKWLLVVVTLFFGIALGAEVFYELTVHNRVSVSLLIIGFLSVGCVLLLWVCVTYAVPAGMAILVLTLFIDGVGYQLTLALLLTGLSAQTTTGTFRRGTLMFMVLWSAAQGSLMADPTSGILLFLGSCLGLFAAYGVGASFRRATTARMQSRRDYEELERSHSESVAAERKSIARDLHDIVAHDITIIAMQSRAAQLSDTDQAYREAVQTIADSSRTALQDLRRMLAVLHSSDQVGPTETVASASELDVQRGCEVFAQRLMGLGFTVHEQITGDLASLSRSVSAALYRMLQECSTNVAKHAGPAATCWIDIAVDAHHVQMTVTNTVPAERQSPEEWAPSGAGLIGVRDRAEAFGGCVQTGLDGKGRWRVLISEMNKA